MSEAVETVAEGKTEQKEFKARTPRLPKRKVCIFCAESNLVIDYKDVARLRKFISEKGKILPKRQTNLCSKHQREITTAVKRARVMSLL